MLWAFTFLNLFDKEFFPLTVINRIAEFSAAEQQSPRDLKINDDMSEGHYVAVAVFFQSLWI